MPHFLKKTSNEEIGAKYGLNRQSNLKNNEPAKNGDIFSSRFHVSESLEASKQWFKRQKMLLKSKNMLFEDPFFQAVDSSLFYSQKPKQNIEWKRPKDICGSPCFVADGMDRFDIKQGELGDCWLLAAIISLSMHPQLVKQVIPEDQEFTSPNYVGAFLFRLWVFGTWYDIVVDDRLPTFRNRLIYLHSTNQDEFWSALFEKAYAKLASSYEALKGGSSSEAMVDFTGGITEVFDLGPSTQNNLWNILEKANKLQSLMGCSVEASPNEVEAKGVLGLIKGHAYSITGIEIIATRRGSINMIRIKNPWGNEYEWQGAWSDKSKEWNDVSDAERKRIGLSISDDGEFWMSFEDFTKQFTKLEICHLSPESEIDTIHRKKRNKWEICIENAEWQKNVSAGGCRNFLDTFHMNPQFIINVTDPDEQDNDNTGTLIIGLMQKEMRSRRQEGQELFTIGYAIYELKDKNYENALLDTKYFRTHASTAKSPSFINTREICGRHKLPIGKYVIVPSTFNPGEEAKFILRIFSEKAYDSKQLDEKTEIVESNWKNDVTPEVKKIEDQNSEKLKQAFLSISGDDKEIDSSDLQQVLNAAFKHENFKFDGFGKETCRSIVAMMDIDQSGKLGFDEFKIMWDDLRLWKTIFKKFDTDKSGTFNSFEIRQALNHLGFRVSNRVYTALATRYADKDGTITFDDYILLLVRLKTIFLTYSAQKKTSTGDGIFPKDEFIQCVLYL